MQTAPGDASVGPDFTIPDPISLPTGENGNQDNPGGINNFPDAQDDLTIDFGFTQALYDWGDAPETGTSFPTTSANNGARHVISGPYLGQAVDSETDGQPTAAADGDDANGDTPDDEDGVDILNPVVPNATVNVEVTASEVCVLNAWMDLNGNGDWDDAGEQIFVDEQLAAGVNSLSFTTPSTVSGTAVSRFRCSTQAGLGYTGEAPDGEVEDYVLASLGDYVWEDANENGIQDAGENPLAGVTVELYDASGNPVLDGDGNPVQVVTGSDGKYEFPGLPPGDYVVKFTPPSGYAISPVDQGGDDTVDSDADIVTGETAVITLTAGETNPDVDAGFYPTQGKVAIGNFVWRDADGNSSFTTGETPVSGVNVWLYQDANGDGVCDPAQDSLVASTQTDANGHYYFLGVTPSETGNAATNYCVVVDRTLLKSQGYLYSSAGGAHDPDTTDETSAGGDDGVPSATDASYVVSQVFAAVEGGQTNTGDAGDPVGYADASAYMTVDFGFIHQDDPPTAVSLTGMSVSGGGALTGALGLAGLFVLGLTAFVWQRRRSR